MARASQILWSALRGVKIAVLGGLALCCGPDLEENTMANGADQLTLGTEITNELPSGGSHSYRLPLEADQFVQVVVDQLGVDVAVDLVAPDSSPVITVDSPIGREGPEKVVAVAAVTGEYRIDVRAAESEAPAGDYRISVGELRPATAKDRERAAAERLFSQAEELRRADSKDSLPQAAERYREALDAWRALPDRAREADTLQRLGWVYDSLGDPQAAREHLTAAIAGYRAASEPRGQGVALNGLGMIRWQLGETDQGLSDVEQALAIFRDLGARDGIAGALNNLGVLHRRLGETEEAITFYEEALGLYRELEDRREEGLILGNIGVLLTQQGKLEEAADHLQSALDIWTARGDLRRMAFARSRLGEVRKRQGRLDDALQDFEEALDLRRRTGNRRGLATTLNGLGTTHLLRGEHPQAKACYEEALAIYREIGDQRGEAITELNLGRLHSTMGEAQRALDLHVQAAPFLRELGDRQIQASNLYGSARALHDLADFEAARERLASTLEHVEELRAETSRQALRIAFFATKQHYHDLYIDVLMHLDEENPQAGHASAAFEAAERRRARALLDVLGEKATDIRQHADPALLEEERSEQRKLNALERRRTALAGRSPGNNEEELTSLEQAERRSRLELDRIRGKIRSTSPRYADLTQPEPCSLAAIQSGLGGNTLLLSYALGEERSFLWLVSKDEIRSHELPGREKIEEDVLEAHRLLTQRRRGVREDRERHLARLSEMLLGPVADGLGTRRLVIVAEDALLYLPFAALPKPETAGSTLLIDHHEIVYLPSASVLLNLRRELAGRHPAPKQLAIFADPVFAPGGSAGEGRSGDREERPEGGALSRSAADFGIETFDPLHHTREEAEAISELAQGEVMKALGLEASKKRVLEGGLHEYQILHFATHGLLNREHPELSGLVLSLVDERGLPQDGFLRLHEIYNLRLSAELVVLSACRTGLGREVRGEGLLGLTRGFMYAGVPRVVVSLWNVSDRATSELMKRFYWCLLKTEASPATALRAAQLSIRDDEEEEQWRHPHYWAGFVLQGEWRLPGQSEDDSWIEGSYTGAAPDDEEDVDYPGPDEVWCDGLTEPWAQKLCHILRRLTSPAGG